ncbi:MAG: hypothetical protein ACODAQ_07740, partial [Phycisphaeraceae bacterium]
RGVHQNMVVYAQSNKTGNTNGQFPGLNPNASIMTNTDANNQLSSLDPFTTIDGRRPAVRFGLMLDENLYSGDYIISPLESNPEGFGSPREAYTPGMGEFTTRHHSYAMLALTDENSGQTGSEQARMSEWSETLNADAAVVSARNTGGNATTQVSSLATQKDSGQFRGGVAWNDNHVGTENTMHVDTKYASNDPVDNDNLFSTSTAPVRDALMTYNADARGTSQ